MTERIGVSPHIFESKAEEFHLKEYEALRREIDVLSQEQKALERYVIFAIGITWGWLFLHQKDLVSPSLPYLIPWLFAILGALRAYGIEQSFGTIGNYIETIEEAFSKEGGPSGWEHYHRGEAGLPDSKGALWFWGVLNLSAAGVFFLRLFHKI